MFEIAVNLIQSTEKHNVCFRGFCPYNVRRRIHVFLWNLSLTQITATDRIHSNKGYKTILMTVQIGVSVVVDDYFDIIYAQVCVRPRL